MAGRDIEGPVTEYFAINLREAREARGMSQADLAQQVKDRGHPFTQATIWKLEQGLREPKLAEAVAIGQALELWSWTELTLRPASFKVGSSIDQWRQRVHQLAELTSKAAEAQLEALFNLAVAVREASDAGWSNGLLEARSGYWLEHAPEMTVLRGVLAARVGQELTDEERDRRYKERDKLAAQIVQALEGAGIQLAVGPDDIEIVGPENAGPEPRPSGGQTEGATP